MEIVKTYNEDKFFKVIKKTCERTKLCIIYYYPVDNVTDDDIIYKKEPMHIKLYDEKSEWVSDLDIRMANFFLKKVFV